MRIWAAVPIKNRTREKKRRGAHVLWCYTPQAELTVPKCGPSFALSANNQNVVAEDSVLLAVVWGNKTLVRRSSQNVSCIVVATDTETDQRSDWQNEILWFKNARRLYSISKHLILNIALTWFAYSKCFSTAKSFSSLFSRLPPVLYECAPGQPRYFFYLIPMPVQWDVNITNTDMMK